MEIYINKRIPVVSPRTIMSYKRIQKNDLKCLLRIKVADMTQDIIQSFVNDDSKKHSPKTVRDNHGLISSVLKQERPEFSLNTILPKNIRPNIYVPSDNDIKRLMVYVSGTTMEIPILLAAFGSMRRGEICALDSSNINKNIVHVTKNMVITPEHQWIIKPPKSYAGDRFIEYPNFVAVKWASISGKITSLNPDNITNRFARLLKSADITHFRFPRPPPLLCINTTCSRCARCLYNATWWMGE